MEVRGEANRGCDNFLFKFFFQFTESVDARSKSPAKKKSPRGTRCTRTQTGRPQTGAHHPILPLTHQPTTMSDKMAAWLPTYSFASVKRQHRERQHRRTDGVSRAAEESSAMKTKSSGSKRRWRWDSNPRPHRGTDWLLGWARTRAPPIAVCRLNHSATPTGWMAMYQPVVCDVTYTQITPTVRTYIGTSLPAAAAPQSHSVRTPRQIKCWNAVGTPCAVPCPAD
eukprot:scaffold23877_cov145-Isochrysis_galbana.AAC.2